METQGLQHKFDYEGTAQGLVDYLWQSAQNQYAKFQARRIRWGETYPYPHIERRRDGTPFLVEYSGSRDITFIDPADGQERKASESVQGVTLELDPLPNGHTRVTAQCHNQAFEAWYSYLLGLFGMQSKPEPTGSKSNFGGDYMNAMVQHHVASALLIATVTRPDLKESWQKQVRPFIGDDGVLNEGEDTNNAIREWIRSVYPQRHKIIAFELRDTSLSKVTDLLHLKVRTYLLDMFPLREHSMQSDFRVLWTRLHCSQFTEPDPTGAAKPIPA